MSVKPGGAALVLAFLLGTGFTVPMSGGGRGEEEGAQGGRFRGRDWGTLASGSGPGVVTGSSLSPAVTPVLTVGAVWKRA